MKLQVVVRGCDDDTVVVINVDSDMLAVIDVLASKINDASSSPCQPTMHLKILEEETNESSTDVTTITCSGISISDS
jgi:hypothetical protein